MYSRPDPCVFIQSNTLPKGFSSEEQFKQVGKELREALDKSGVTYSKVGVRGSSVTNVSSKGGGFRIEAQGNLKKSDIDAFIEFSRDVNLSESKKIPGFIHPDKIMGKYPLLEEWSEKWSKSLNREITPGGFKPGTFTDKKIKEF